MEILNVSDKTCITFYLIINVIQPHAGGNPAKKALKAVAVRLQQNHLESHF